MTNHTNPKVLAVQIIAAILEKPQSEILNNKNLKIKDLIDSPNGNEGGIIPFKIWKGMQLNIGNKIDLT